MPTTNTHVADEGAKALGFRDAAHAKEHEAWLWKNGTNTFRVWLREVAPERANELEKNAALP